MDRKTTPIKSIAQKLKIVAINTHNEALKIRSLETKKESDETKFQAANSKNKFDITNVCA